MKKKMLSVLVILGLFSGMSGYSQTPGVLWFNTKTNKILTTIPDTDSAQRSLYKRISDPQELSQAQHLLKLKSFQSQNQNEMARVRKEIARIENQFVSKYGH